VPACRVLHNSATAGQVHSDRIVLLMLLPNSNSQQGPGGEVLARGHSTTEHGEEEGESTNLSPASRDGTSASSSSRVYASKVVASWNSQLKRPAVALHSGEQRGHALHR